MNLLLLIVLIILLVGALPTWPYSSGWGYYPSGGLGPNSRDPSGAPASWANLEREIWLRERLLHRTREFAAMGPPNRVANSNRQGTRRVPATDEPNPNSSHDDISVLEACGLWRSPASCAAARRS